MTIDSKLSRDISSFCSLNGIDEDKYLNELLKKAFMLDKYGDRPPVYGATPKRLEEIPETKKKIISNYEFTFEFKEKSKRTSVKRVKPEVMEEIKTEETEKPKEKRRKLSAK